MLEVMFEDKPKIAAQKDHLKPIFVYRNQDNLTSIGVPASGSISGIEVLRRQLSGLFTEEEEKELLERVGEADPTVKPFLKGAVCICQECLAKFEEYATDLPLEEDDDEDEENT